MYTKNFFDSSKNKTCMYVLVNVSELTLRRKVPNRVRQFTDVSALCLYCVKKTYIVFLVLVGQL